MSGTQKHIIQKHFDKAVALVSQYDGKEPLQHYLKKYFSANKQHGSKDRKAITHFCYTFFRIGKNLPDKSVEEKLRAALFVCEDSIELPEEIFNQEWLQNHSPEPDERIDFIQKIYPGFSLDNIFPYEKELSGSIDATAFQRSFLYQPKVFLRIRNGMGDIVSDKLQKADIAFETIGEDCISVPQNVNIASVLQLNKEAVVQDLSSQKIKSFLQSIHYPNQQNHLIKVWDCCAASGGKSILASDVFDKTDLTVSDIRPQILHNLKLRFREAGIDKYKNFTADLSRPVLLKSTFDLVVCDAPCSGSGTWARTPEALAVFDFQQIEHYHNLQRKIIANTLPHVRAGGYFLYITCSVFEKENEEQAQYIANTFAATCIRSEALKGYAHRADSMFAALFRIEK